jgi:hypothetical protein
MVDPGNCPIDYNILHSHAFDTEDEACQAAVELRDTDINTDEFFARLDGQRAVVN